MNALFRLVDKRLVDCVTNLAALNIVLERLMGNLDYIYIYIYVCMYFFFLLCADAGKWVVVVAENVELVVPKFA